VNELVLMAFRALGSGPTWRELELAADAIRESGDEQALALFEGWDTSTLSLRRPRRPGLVGWWRWR
jgi:hypothetical protein